MLQWNELRVTPDGKHLIIDVQVQDMDYYTNVFINSLYLNVYKNPEDFVSAMPDSKSVLLWEEVVNAQESDTRTKRVRKFIDIDSIAENLFFIYAVSDGEPSAETPCGCKDHILMGITYNKSLLYKNSVKAISTVNDCTPSPEFIDYILQEKAFELSLKTGDYRGAIKYWNQAFKKSVNTVKSCGCYGS